MVTKIKPRRIKSDNPWSLWDFLGYQDEATFQWWKWWWGWDMFYDDFNFVALTWSVISLELSTKIEPSSNFTVNLPTDIKDWQEYILRVSNWNTPYTMTLWNGVENPWDVDLALTPNAVDMFVFLAVEDKLELQPEWGSNNIWTTSYFKTRTEYDALPATKTSDWNLYIIVDNHNNLLEYYELIAWGTHTDILNKLNTYPQEYYDKYNNEGHTEYVNSSLWYVLIDGIWERTYIWGYIFGFKDWEWSEYLQQ